MATKRRCSGRRTLWVLAALVLGLAATGEARIRAGGFEISGQFFQFGEFRWGGKANEHSYFLRNDQPILDVGGRDGDQGLFEIFQTQPWSRRNNFKYVNSFRHQLRLEIAYLDLPYVTPVIKLQPFWDGMYKWDNRGDGIEKYWEHNIGKQDRWDPLVREAYVDINLRPFYIRAGRQIVVWGRSDGVSVLDVVNPNNFRSPLIFEQEKFRIPLWMLNVNYDLGDFRFLPGVQKELQVIWNLKYQPSRFPGFTPREEGDHPWTINVVDLANQVVKSQEDIYREESFFDNYAYNDRDFLDQTEVFVRYQGRIMEGIGPLSDFTYSLHFANLMYRIPSYNIRNRLNLGYAIWLTGPRNPTNPNWLLASPDTSASEISDERGLDGVEKRENCGLAPNLCPPDSGGIDLTTRRYNIVGASFDKALDFLPGQLRGTVLRSEASYSFGNNYYDPDLNDRRRDNFTALIGLDQYLYVAPRWVFATPWFTSFQVWNDHVMSKPTVGEYTRIGSAACDRSLGCGRKGFIDIGSFDLFNGLRKRDRTVLTLFMFNDFLSGKTLHVELFGLHELQQQGTWFRGLVGYVFNSTTSMRVGYHQLWGPRDTFFGQFKDNQEVFTELLYTF